MSKLQMKAVHLYHIMHTLPRTRHSILFAGLMSPGWPAILDILDHHISQSSLRYLILYHEYSMSSHTQLSSFPCPLTRDLLSSLILPSVGNERLLSLSTILRENTTVPDFWVLLIFNPPEDDLPGLLKASGPELTVPRLDAFVVLSIAA